MSYFSLPTQKNDRGSAVPANKLSVCFYLLPVALTGVWYHQASSRVAEYAGGPLLLFAGAEGPVEGEQALFSSIRGAAVVPAQVPREGLGGGFGVELRPLGHT